MARRRHLLNPAKVKADFQAIEESQPEATFAEKFGLHRRLTVILLNLLAALVMAISFPLVAHWHVSGEWYLAYVGLVPWTLALAGRCGRRWVLGWNFIGALLFWSTMYWLTWVTLVGYFALVAACAVFWLAAAVVLRAALRRGWPMWIVLPVVWVSLEYARAYTMTGYPWYNLSLTQYARVHLIQICDLTGHYGVSFFVAMVNGAIVDVCLAPWRGAEGARAKVARRVIVPLGATLGMLGALISYGAWRISQSEQTTSLGPVIGVVQHDIAIELGGSGVGADERLAMHAGLTLAALKDTNCELVIWPETMLPEWVNPEMLQADIDTIPVEEVRSMASIVFGRQAAEKYEPEILRRELKARLQNASAGRSTSSRQHAEYLARLAVVLDCPLLAGGTTGHPNPDPVDEWDHWVIRNSALWFEPVPDTAKAEDYRRRHLATAQYAKRHPVPFSETVPFKHGWPWLHRQLRVFVPASMPQLDPGTERTRFLLKRSAPGANGSASPWRLAVAICFEGTFARRCREVVMEDGEKAADILVNMSNDGWFVHKRGENSYDASTEHMQHLAMYCFRAVENRVPVVRAVNTGVSASIDSNGRIVSMVQRFDAQTNIPRALLLGGRSINGEEISERAQQSPHKSPQLAERVLVDERVSPYSVIGDVFAMLASAVAIGIAVVLVLMSGGRCGRMWKACRAKKA